jgi:hypothetical protein
VASKRSPQTAAKREREMAVKEKRERKRQRRQAAIAAREAGPVEDAAVAGGELGEDAPADEDEAGTGDAPDGAAPAEPAEGEGSGTA